MYRYILKVLGGLYALKQLKERVAMHKQPRNESIAATQLLWDTCTALLRNASTRLCVSSMPGWLVFLYRMSRSS